MTEICSLKADFAIFAAFFLPTYSQCIAGFTVISIDMSTQQRNKCFVLVTAYSIETGP